VSPISIRPETAADRSRAFIMAINAKWVPSLSDGSLTYLIRKRLPYRDDVEEAYFHAKSPVSALFGRAKVVGIEKVSIATAIGRKKDLHMSELEIRSYTRGLSEIGLMQLSLFEATVNPVSTQVIREDFNYFPPQSFAFISRTTLPQIIDLCGF
jgi:predicted transcriptional regulator